MRVKFCDNLGSRDAEKYALDFRACGRGMECDVSETAAQWLIRKGIATEVAEKPPAFELPKQMKAIPNVPSIGEADAPGIAGESRPARGAAKKFNNL